MTSGEDNMQGKTETQKNVPDKGMPDVKIKITWNAPQGTIFTASKLAQDSGLEAYYLNGVTDEKEREKRQTDLYRHINAIIKMLEHTGVIAMIGTDRFARNGIRGKPPKVYRVKRNIDFEWHINGTS